MPTKEDFEIALAIACEDFGQRDPSLQAEKAGVAWKPASGGEGGRAEVPFLATSYLIQGPAGDVSYKEDQGKEPALWEKILVLHYFGTADGTAMAKDHISFKDMGDFAVTIPVFPRVPVTLVFWKQDEEFEARLTILFDRTVIRYLPTEDIVLSTQMMAYRLIGMAGRS